MYGYIACRQICAPSTYKRGPAEDREGLGFPETEGTDDCELPCEIWKLSLGPLQELQGSFTAEPTL